MNRRPQRLGLGATPVVEDSATTSLRKSITQSLKAKSHPATILSDSEASSDDEESSRFASIIGKKSTSSLVRPVLIVDKALASKTHTNFDHNTSDLSDIEVEPEEVTPLESVPLESDTKVETIGETAPSTRKRRSKSKKATKKKKKTESKDDLQTVKPTPPPPKESHSSDSDFDVFFDKKDQKNPKTKGNSKTLSKKDIEMKIKKGRKSQRVKLKSGVMMTDDSNALD
ncbi:hypothetical protein GEMRC1_005315 [Eukaryota sp. GEM-RC1]